MRWPWHLILIGLGLLMLSLLISGRSPAVSPIDVLVQRPTHGLRSQIAHRQIEWPDFGHHPLPPSLAATESWAAAGDYFDQIQKVEVGYLVWSDFPIRVYLNPPDTFQAQMWQSAAETAIQEWQAYLPLEIVDQPEQANITIQSAHTSHRTGARVRSAETIYELWLDAEGILRHRCTVIVHPNQSPKFVLAALRHELGHALGIWGHSPLETDALYFAQVREPSPLSKRDINTLRRVYEQPTRLGWLMPNLADDRPEMSAD